MLTMRPLALHQRKGNSLANPNLYHSLLCENNKKTIVLFFAFLCLTHEYGRITVWAGFASSIHIQLMTKGIVAIFTLNVLLSSIHGQMDIFQAHLVIGNAKWARFAIAEFENGIDPRNDLDANERLDSPVPCFGDL